MSHAYYNGVIIIESLDGKQTGKELYNELETTVILANYKKERANFFKDYYDISNRAELLGLLDMLRLKCKSDYIYPLLHFEMHGMQVKKSKKAIGVILKNGDKITWDILGNYTRKLNIAMENNLVLGMAVCCGAHLLNASHITSPSPYWGIIASETEIKELEIPKIFSKLYREIIENRLINEIIREINLSYDSKLIFIPTEKLFLGGILKYFDQMCNPNSLQSWMRINRLGIQAAIMNPWAYDIQKASRFAANFVFSEDNKRNAFNKYSNIYFMKSLGNNSERFSQFTYEWLLKNRKYFK